MNTQIKAKDFEWDAYEGEVDGIYGDYEYEIGISAAVKGNRWGERASNIRTWIAYGPGRVEIARGDSDGLRAAKRDAIAAVNAARNI